VNKDWLIVRTKEARQLGAAVLTLIESSRIDHAHALLSPVLAKRTSFRILDCIGEIIGAGSLEDVNVFLDQVADGETVRGWAVIGKVLGTQLERDFEDALERCRNYIITADVWHGADALAERVPGPALVNHFNPAFKAIGLWRDDPNPWVRRAIGTALHFWAKRTRGTSDYIPNAALWLDWVEPMFEERDIKVVKGVGWGLKTLGKYYLQLVTEWLVKQINQKQRQPRRLILRKAMTYLTEKQCARIKPIKST
jgi:3-methyladenine DNA glycosylase AlkD